MSYIYELWIGKEKKYWNWELKGLEEDDYNGRVKACNDLLDELQIIKEYYESLAK